MKKFIMTSPYQPEGKLKCQIYKAVDNSRLQYDREISFPILAAINAYVETGEEIEVSVIVSEYENAEKNFVIFCEQLDKICKEKNISVKNGKPEKISVPYNEFIDTQLETFSKIIEKTEDNDTLYVCMSYGTKAVPIVQMMALNYAYKVCKNVNIGCIVYGSVDFNTQEMCIYDITSLFYMNQIVDTVAEMKPSDPAAVIKALL